MENKEFKERVANLCHEQWSGWMEYLFSKCAHKPKGDFIIPSNLVKRWKRQVDTPYEDLSEEEKDSDRKEADKFVKLFSDKVIEIANQEITKALESLRIGEKE
jgi:hypothetical protein